MKKILSILTFLIALPCAAQTEVSSFAPGNGEGVTYFLPDTKLEVAVTVNCITRTAGEFAAYADRFLRLTDVIKNDEKYWEIVDVKVVTEGVPCKEKAYTIKLNSNSSASNIFLNEDGIINSINREPEPLEEDAFEERESELIDPHNYLTEEILQATSTAKMAELVSKEVYQIRESKLAITRGNADNMPKDGLSMQLMLDELNRQERSLTSLFVGTCDTISHTFYLDITPVPGEDIKKNILFRFSRKLGVVNSDDLAGAPVYYDLAAQGTVEQPAEKGKTVKREGVCYIVPGRAKIKVYNSAKVFAEKELSIAQFGSVEILSKKLFNKNKTTKVLFDTATGAIISIE